MKNVTRRNFLATSAAAAGTATLVACGNATESGDDTQSSATTATTDDIFAAPDASAYPIDPDGDDVEALYTSETTRADGWTRYTNPEGGVEIGVMDTARMIQVNGLAFRDMDGDGKLSLFEDWRQSAEDRAADLASKLSAEECVQLMWHGGVEDSSEDAEDPDFGALSKGSCAGVSRLGGNAENYVSVVSWINEVQEKCEQRPWGIPYLCSVDPYDTFGIPSTIGLAPAMDKDLFRKAGNWTSRAWSSIGVRIELGPQIDLYTHPTVKRLSGAETEDPALARDFTQAFGGGMQSTWGDDDATDDLGWGSESVAVMLKHYVGAGAIETACDDHNDQGKFDVFPGDNYNAHLIPFLDGGMHLDSKTEQMSAVMPNYGLPWSEDEEYGERVGGGFNKAQISILRNAGWDGMITTDWGIINSGRSADLSIENMTQQERYRKMLDATVDQYGGGFMPDEVGTPVYEEMVADLGEDEALARVQDSARRIFTVMVHTQLFDQPYSDRTLAGEVFGSEAAAAFAEEANEKCVIMLKNAGNVISKDGIGDKPKVYIPQTFSPASSGWGGTTPASINPGFDEEVSAKYFDVVTDGIGDPTGEPAEEGGDAQYQESDIQRLSDFSDVEYALIKVQNPQDANGGSTGGSSMFGGDSGEPVEFLPVTLQYRPYTADSDSVKKTSIAGDIAADGTQENRAHYGKSTYATNEAELDLVISVKEALPESAKLILVVDADKPMVFSEIEPYADVILMGWDGISDEAFAKVITGAVEPSALLTFQMPANMDTVESQLEDVPRDMDCYTDSEGNTYDFAFGLNWSGVIDDDRTATYKANPLTEPECEIKRDDA